MKKSLGTVVYQEIQDTLYGGSLNILRPRQNGHHYPWVRCIMFYITSVIALVYPMSCLIGRSYSGPHWQLYYDILEITQNDFYTPVWKMVVLCLGNVLLSICLSVQVFRPFIQHAFRYQFETWCIHSVGGTTCRVWVSSQMGLIDLLYSQK